MLPNWRDAGEGEREGFLLPFEHERLRLLPVPPVVVDLLPLSMTAKVICVCLAVDVGAGLEAGCFVGSPGDGGGGCWMVSVSSLRRQTYFGDVYSD